MLDINEIFIESEETRVIIGRLEDGRLSDGNKVLLTHLLNIVNRRERCAYYGRVLGENDGLKDRCLAPELESRKGISMPCPFYDSELESRCNYTYNKKSIK